MRTYVHRKHQDSWELALKLIYTASVVALSCIPFVQTVHAQNIPQAQINEELQSLTAAIARTQAQVEQSQHELESLHQQVAALQAMMAHQGANALPSATPVPKLSPDPQGTAVSSSAGVDRIQEQQAIDESQIKTLDQTKVETNSKYPVKINGMLLLNGFVNTRQVDVASTPTVAVPGSGSTGISVRQTLLGFEAYGPHLFGGQSYADLNIDFAGNPASSSSVSGYTGYSASNATLLRLRTVHAGLRWEHSQAYFSLDRPIFSPDTPTSFTAVAEPALAWSGNLWTWNPQIGFTQDLPVGTRAIRLQAALMDVGDAPWSAVTASSATGGPAASLSEQSRWPSTEARIALLGSSSTHGSHLGIAGYFSPHLGPDGERYYAWAGTMDAQVFLPGHLILTSAFYRGEALGGLGAGGFKDFGYSHGPTPGTYYFRPLDDVGGWAQLKEKWSEQLEFNSAFGIDNVFANELHSYNVTGGTVYQDLARNRTFTGNVIYSPRSYLLFSLEYRHLDSSPITGLPSGSNVIGLGVGYKF